MMCLSPSIVLECAIYYTCNMFNREIFQPVYLWIYGMSDTLVYVAVGSDTYMVKCDACISFQSVLEIILGFLTVCLCREVLS